MSGETRLALPFSDVAKFKAIFMNDPRPLHPADAPLRGMVEGRRSALCAKQFEGEEGRSIRTGRFFGKVVRSYQPGHSVDAGQARACFSDAVFRLILPRRCRTVVID
ncbi:Hsp20/alpha crystallin family protein [Denitromonas iodatirespirans]|uniref:Hsp20/alpha crystallin family protein n=1 Tax=Denitromonas iodatirespirans TaxID=2795389 RepID=A0A944D7Y6_DENI1|nr:Hsp20/alpha crystallin family protein [Denitromonas iodatirespirans]MBT0961490.1 Hsp20/alpha crystallin family protein [Denitromonas iodatirespirans]